MLSEAVRRAQRSWLRSRSIPTRNRLHARVPLASPDPPNADSVAQWAQPSSLDSSLL